MADQEKRLLAAEKRVASHASELDAVTRQLAGVRTRTQIRWHLSMREFTQSLPCEPTKRHKLCGDWQDDSHGVMWRLELSVNPERPKKVGLFVAPHVPVSEEKRVFFMLKQPQRERQFTHSFADGVNRGFLEFVDYEDLQMCKHIDIEANILPAIGSPSLCSASCMSPPPPAIPPLQQQQQASLPPQQQQTSLTAQQQQTTLTAQQQLQQLQQMQQRQQQHQQQQQQQQQVSQQQQLSTSSSSSQPQQQQQ